MEHLALLLIRALLALVQIALLSLIGQGLLALFAGTQRDRNPVYSIFRMLTAPILRCVRVIVPKVVVDRHLPYVAFFLLFWLGLALANMKRSYCAAQALVC